MVATQNHDQVGNRAAGERASALMSDGRLRVAAALLLTAPFVPMLFQGEEWGASTPFQYFTDHEDAELGAAVSEGRRQEFAAFGWEPAEHSRSAGSGHVRAVPAGLGRDRGRTPPRPAGLVPQLIALRRKLPDLTDPRLDRVETACDPALGWLTVRRGAVLVAANLGDRDWACPASLTAELLAVSDPRVERTDQAVVLPPDTVAILSLPCQPAGAAPAASPASVVPPARAGIRANSVDGT